MIIYREHLVVKLDHSPTYYVYYRHMTGIVRGISAFGPEVFHAALQVPAIHAAFIFLVYNVILVIKNNCNHGHGGMGRMIVWKLKSCPECNCHLFVQSYMDMQQSIIRTVRLLQL